jgi:uncharacterized membrane protein YbhN (UPF0104 family)
VRRALVTLGLCWEWLDEKRHPIAVVVGSGVVTAAVAFLLALVPGYDRVLTVIGAMRPEWFAVCFGALALAYAGYVLALRETVRLGGGPELGLRHSAQIVAAGFGAFFAVSAAGGFEIDYWSLRRAGLSRHDAMVRVLGLGTLEYAVLACAALASALALLFGAGKQPYFAVTVPWLLVIPGIAFAVWASSPCRSARLSRTSGHRLPRQAFGHAVSGLVVLRRLALSPGRHRLAFAGTALYWFGEIACLWASLRAFHEDVAIPALVLAYATGYVLTRRALPAGGAGVAEALLTLGLVSLGVAFAPALCAVFAYRLFNFWLALVPAMIAFPTADGLRRAMRAVEREIEPGGV